MSFDDSIEVKSYIFGTVLLLANKMSTYLDRTLKDYDVTSKQWLLSAVIKHKFKESPTIKEVSMEMGTSHQNIKQLALKLEQKGLLIMEKDKRDLRATRIKLSDDGHHFYQKIQNLGIEFLENIFKDIDYKNLAITVETLDKILLNIMNLDVNETWEE